MNDMLPLNTTVINFGVRAKVVAYHDLHVAGDKAGYVLRECGRRTKWLADPTKCTKVEG